MLLYGELSGEVFMEKVVEGMAGKELQRNLEEDGDFWRVGELARMTRQSWIDCACGK